ncbi:MAG: L,D-transpeptidase [Tildeniella nuda ZEHNDER 1965/U140]|jgi:lipoprotein-anchoring transpeptidase ErfK/SrfK|nr:L,D-transpeptidase [Tildeniella nuda ZEHNDER 1965/U140]
MHSNSQRSAIAYWSKQIAAIASCTGLLTGLLMTHTALTARTVDAALDRPTLQSNAPVATSVVRLEIHLNRRQAILYQGSTLIKRYPIGTGRQGWETPVGTFQVMQMKRNPTWISPFTNERIAANDPRNPLRGYWIGFWTNGRNWIGFHGTLNASSVGKAASHGCIHMYDRDLQDLFAQVSLGTQVKVVP